VVYSVVLFFTQALNPIERALLLPLLPARLRRA